MASWEWRPRLDPTPLLMNLAAVVERTDEGILPAVYFFIGRSLHATLPQLGILTSCRAVVQAMTSPLSGILGDRYDRTHIVAAGCILWGAMTAMVGLCTSLRQAMVACALNGVGLALVIPNVQSVVADCHPSEQRGRAFGLMSLTSSLGGMAGAFFATNAGAGTYYGIEGWRFAFYLVAVVSVITAALVYYFACDPRHPEAVAYAPAPPREVDALERTFGPGGGEGRVPRVPEEVLARMPEGLQIRKTPAGGLGEVGLSVDPQPRPPLSSSGGSGGSSPIPGRSVLDDVKSVLQIRSFQVLILQGIVGSVPWQAMVMFTVWFQLLGFTDLQAGSCMAIFGCGCAIGSFLGGHIGDAMAARMPGSGRVLTNQVSVVAGLPMAFLLIKGLPPPTPENSHFMMYGATLLLMGLLVSWCGCNNSALFADLVPEHLRSTIYAFDRSFEGAVGACGAPLVGLVAERVFGFSGTVGGGRGSPDTARNARALGDALLVLLTVPWLACLVFFTGMHWTFPRDCAAAHRTLRKATSEVDLSGVPLLEVASRRRRMRP